MSNAKTGYTPKTLVYLIIGILLMFVFGQVCPTWAAVTDPGVKIIGVFLGWIFLVITGFGLMIPSLLAMFAMLFTGFYTATDVMASGFGSNVPLLCVFAMALIYAFRSTKGDEVIVRYIISRPFLSGHPTRFLLAFNLTITILSVFMDIGGMMLGFAFINAIANVAGYKSDTNFRRYMLATTFILSQAAMNVLPSKQGSLLTIGSFSGAIIEAGYSLDMACYIMVNLAIALIFAVVLSLIAKPVFKADLAPLKTLDVGQLVKDGAAIRLNKRQVISSIIMVAGFIFPVIQMLFPADSAIYTWMGNIGQVIFMILLMGLLEIIHVKGEPICKATEAFSKGVYWDIYVGTAAIVLLSGAMSSADSGIGAWIGQIFGVLFSEMSFPLLLLVVIVVSGIVTQVFSNVATMVLVSSVISQFVIDYAASGINVAVFAALIAQVCQLGCLTVAGSAYVALMQAEPGMRERPNWIFFGGSVMMIIYFIIAIPVGIFFGYVF